MRVISPAKINLSLSVGAIRSDGYHDVDSFFQLISLHDVLEINPADTFRFSSSLNLGISDSDNLVVRAAEAMSEAHGRDLPKLHIHLEKHIPHGAGLGGGSSNAAAVIFALSQLWGLAAGDQCSLDVAAKLGSDVPLFLAPTTASIMTGRGEILKESRAAVEGLLLLIVKPPGAHSPTPAVYQAFDADPQKGHNLDVWHNNLEKAAIAVSPQTGELLAWLRSQEGVELAQVAGSGSACWAQVKDIHTLSILAEKAKKQGFWAAESASVSRGIYLQSDKVGLGANFL